MSTIVKIIFLACVVLTVEGILYHVGSRQSVEAAKHRDDLVRKNAGLKSSLRRVATELQSARETLAQLRPIIPVPSEGVEYVPWSLETLKKVSFDLLADEHGPYLLGRKTNLKLSEDAIGVLGLTPEETSQAEDAFAQLRARIQDLQRGAARLITRDQLSKDEQARLSRTMHNFGEVTYYEIAAPSDEQLDTLHAWFNDRLTNAIGPERSDVIIEKLSRFKEIWPDKGQREIIIFVDTQDDRDGTPMTYWYTLAPAGPHQGSGLTLNGRTSKSTIPSELAYLFQAGEGAPATTNLAP